MPGRGTVIKGLKCCKRKDGNECKVCPYTESEYCVEDMVADALALLEEQEAEIRQLRLALDIAKGTCNGIKSGGG